jgi:uncharacterized protein (DUF1684 family)
MIARTFLVVAALAIGADAAHVKEVEAWRAKHEADYRRDWVTVSGLFFLKQGPNRAGSDPSNDIVLPRSGAASIGTFVVDGARVRLEPHEGVRITLADGTPVVKPIDLKSDLGAPAVPEDILSVGPLTFSVHVSGDRLAIRTRDEQGPEVQAFLGFQWFPIDGQYRVTGRFIKDPAPHDVILPNLLGDKDTYRTEGIVEFTLNGRTLHMRPMTTRPKRFYFIFKDQTSGKETYEAARFLYSDLKDDGTTVLDFNEAYNPPCAFNPYTTCPFPPVENRLKIRIPAGEKKYPQHPPKPAD